MESLSFGLGGLEAEFWRWLFIMTRIGAALFAAPKAGPPKGADRFTYVVSYVHNGKTQTITVPEDRMPAELSSLVVDQLPRR